MVVVQWKLTTVWGQVPASARMTTSSNGNIFRVTGTLGGEFTVHRWIPRTKASEPDLWCFFDLPLKKRLKSLGWWFETPWRPLCRHRNDNGSWPPFGDRCRVWPRHHERVGPKLTTFVTNRNTITSDLSSSIILNIFRFVNTLRRWT